MFYKKFIHGGLIALLLSIIAAFINNPSTPSQPIAHAETPQQSTTLEACVLTPELLGGQGFALAGQGFAFSGQGFAFSGQGFAFSGMGFAFSGQGFALAGMGIDPAEVAQEIIDNPTSSEWLLNLMPSITAGSGYDTVPTAILVVDDFSNEFSHGNFVVMVFEDLLESVNATNITLIPVDVSGVDVSYEMGDLEDKVRTTIEGPSDQFGANGLIGQGYKHFVINLSFGIIPCSAPEFELDGQPMPAFSFSDLIAAIVDYNTPDEPQSVEPILECVAPKGRNDYVAYFGYDNKNETIVNIPVGDDNRFNRIGDRLQPRIFEPGLHENVFSVEFSGTLRWTLEGPDGESRTVTANRYSTPCETEPPAPTQSVVPLLQCVADNGDGTYTARFGYQNFNDTSVTVPVGFKNRFNGAWDRGQSITFLPGLHEDIFRVEFNGGTLRWRLKGPGNQTYTVTATKDSQLCIDQYGYGLINYLTDIGVPEDMVEDYIQALIATIEDEADLTNFRNLLKSYLAESATSNGEFAVIPIAAAGNYRPWLYTYPLTPANWEETIAVSGTLGNYGGLWRFSQDGNVAAPAAGYPLADDFYLAGTSFATAFVGSASALWLTHPNACIFDGTRPPLISNAFAKDANIPFDPAGVSPLNCYANAELAVVNPGDQVNAEGQTVNLPIEAHGSGALEYTAENLPIGLSIDAFSGVIGGTLSSNSAGSYLVAVSVTDGVNTSTINFTWLVNENSILGTCYASSVVSYMPGTRRDGTRIFPFRSDPNKALGEPQRNDTFNFVSLGFGNGQNTGVLVLEFDHPILNREGIAPDVQIWETSFDDENRSWSKYPEAVRVQASQDGLNWVTIGQTTSQDEAYDLGSLDWAKFIKLTDISNPHKFNRKADGFDVDGVEGFVCELGTANPVNSLPTAELIQAENTLVSRSGAWRFGSANQASGGGYLYNNNGSKNDTLSFNFEGSAVEIIYVSAPGLGAFTVFIDDTAVRTVTTADSSVGYNSRTVINYLTEGIHTLKIVPDNGVVAIDAFYIYSH